MSALRLTRYATYVSVFVALVLLVTKAFAWWETGSVGVLASMLDSAVDVVASMMILFAVHVAQMPADNEHRLGHGKAEPLASLAQSVFIAGSALYLVLHALDRLFFPEAVREADLGVWVMVFSMALTLALVMFQRYVIRKTHSTAIESDSLHYLSDLGANFAVMIGLLLSAWFWVDAALGLIIGAWIGWQAVKLAMASGNQLLDRELPDSMRDEIREIVLKHPQVRGFNDLRTFRSGPTVFIQLDLELDDHLSLWMGHQIAEEVTESLRQNFENADVMIHQEPVSFRNKPGHHQWEVESKS
ncbi:cation-efflux pump FieF [Thiomicrospira sp. XS5]|uniref:cation diffusion facilitator family transporter n=1 Tax=Thiomicrospira sp. XS5 TaxID=1775636 RepID=UPI00074832F3|nr:cation diffusion facilitator family transporter [Thiomicrospira sp. XS5]KUJ74423.1 cation-efflux pump FieF [Thiomicrospira sp. XS5]